MKHIKCIIIAFCILLPLNVFSQIKPDYSSFAKIYGFVRYYSPNPYTANWDDYDWGRVCGYLIYQYANGNESLPSVFLPLAPDYTISTTPQEGLFVNKAPSDTTYCWRYIGGGSIEIADHVKQKYPEIANYKPYYKELVVSQKDTPVPDSIYSYEISDNLWLNMPHALSKSRFSKIQTEQLLETSKKYWKQFEDIMIWREIKSSEFPDEVLKPFMVALLSSSIEKWNAIEHFYPYYDDDNLLWHNKLQPLLDATLKSSNIDKHFYSLNYAASSLNDGHFTIVPIVEMSKDKFLPYGRQYLPLSVDYVENNAIITAISPELTTKLKKYDIITSIDGVITDSIISQRKHYISTGTNDCIPIKALNEFLRTCDYKKPYIFTVKRGSEIITDTVITSMVYPYFESKTDSTITIIDKKILIFRATNSEADYAYFLSNIDKFKKAKKIIFDVRGYPHYDFMNILSHFSTSPIQLPKFVKKVSCLPNRKFSRKNITQDSVECSTPFINKEVLFLANHSTQSWGETVMMSVKYNKIGKIIGSRTSGTNGDITYFNHPVYRMIVTGMQTFYPDGSQFHGVGVVPDIEVKPSIDGFTNGKDEVLEKAIKY
ncbi:MAG: S41 family peptidase [Oscillospiraceae bacterium]